MAAQEPPELVVSVSEFVALTNQTLEYAYPSVVISGELANFRISKNKWVYFDLKDELASVRFFGTVYQLPGPLEDGMVLKVRGQPRLHPLYGFSVNLQHIAAAGAGTIRRAAELLKAKLAAEGLFDAARKRPLAYPPARVGLIASSESAAYADLIKILSARWQGLDLEFVDVQVQGEPAAEQITRAIEFFNQRPEPPEVLVITRGGGSAEDLQAFSAEQVTRAVAASRVPTLVAIGHEIDTCLAELVADQRASTPSHAAEILVPDRRQVLASLTEAKSQLTRSAEAKLQLESLEIRQKREDLSQAAEQLLKHQRLALLADTQLLAALSPAAVLARGYAVVRKNRQIVRRQKDVAAGDIVDVQLIDGQLVASVKEVRSAKGRQASG